MCNTVTEALGEETELNDTNNFMELALGPWL